MSELAVGIIALCMIYKGGVIEHTYIKDQKMSTCLKMKRTVERSVNPQNVRMACGKIKAMVETDEAGRKKITKIIEDKY
jgi:hypothetical protein|tara:strand:- start:210 stop:446 length:237 start_codon:yes stop_codon:yes gene_type:complete